MENKKKLEIIDKVIVKLKLEKIKILKQEKEKEKEKELGVEHTITSGTCTIKAKIKKDIQRITLIGNETEPENMLTHLTFKNRKVSTIKDLADCLNQAVKLAENKPIIEEATWELNYTCPFHKKDA